MSSYIEQNTKLQSNLDIEIEYKKIPLYKRISAGYGACADEIEEFITVPCTGEFYGDIFGIIVHGDSMEDTILDGSVVFIRRTDWVDEDKIGAFLINGEAFLKRVSFKENGDLLLKSDNICYKDIEIKESDEFEIIGVYIGTFEQIEK
ncbi:S24 family peptidase [uncultured Fusobacterium sp.]|uniref:LexA family protein n=1 Tax=uncultured Fusobacterium sp. TaxID=159267 RepID=UPI0027DBB661|nr:S24 family peptidase [uncultured Fusobacterium sp.]